MRHRFPRRTLGRFAYKNSGRVGLPARPDLREEVAAMTHASRRKIRRAPTGFRGSEFAGAPPNILVRALRRVSVHLASAPSPTHRRIP